MGRYLHGNPAPEAEAADMRGSFRQVSSPPTSSRSDQSPEIQDLNLWGPESGPPDLAAAAAGAGAQSLAASSCSVQTELEEFHLNFLQNSAAG